MFNQLHFTGRYDTEGREIWKDGDTTLIVNFDGTVVIL